MVGGPRTGAFSASLTRRRPASRAGLGKSREAYVERPGPADWKRQEAGSVRGSGVTVELKPTKLEFPGKSNDFIPSPFLRSEKVFFRSLNFRESLIFILEL